MFQILIAALMTSVFASQKYPIDAPMDGPISLYTPVIVKMLKNWPPKNRDLAPPEDGSLKIKCLSLPENDFYVGAEHVMTVHAPMATIEAILDDIGHYKDLFPYYADTHIDSNDRNMVVTFWEQKIPVFFIPNKKYRLVYLIDKSDEKKRVYRYKFRDGDLLHYDDGVIVLESKGPNETTYVEYDFVESSWGPFGSGMAWNESIKGLYQSDVAVKLKAEHPDWEYKKVRDESDKITDKAEPARDACIKAKTKFSLLSS